MSNTKITDQDPNMGELVCITYRAPEWGMEESAIWHAVGWVAKNDGIQTILAGLKADETGLLSGPTTIPNGSIIEVERLR